VHRMETEKENNKKMNERIHRQHVQMNKRDERDQIERDRKFNSK
jgi:hypothetical protein